MREHSSVGSEHLLYTQRVIGSSPIVPTGRGSERQYEAVLEGSIAQLV